jgi:hypothetical protein
MRFRATIEQSGKTATGIPVPEEVLEQLGGGRKPAVKVVLNDGFEYRTSVGSMGGRAMLPLSGERRAEARVTAGEDVDVDLTIDSEPRVADVPEDLAAALEADPAAKTAFEKLAYSHQLAHALAVSGAKTPETRQRRVDGVLAKLRA